MLITFPENSFISKSTVPVSLLKMFFGPANVLQCQQKFHAISGTVWGLLFQNCAKK